MPRETARLDADDLRFVTFEGGEGAGKSTQVRRLRDRLEQLGCEVVVTREPGGTRRAERIRDFLLCGGGLPFGPLAEALLFASARADHVDEVIRPALERGAVVLCDRFADSSRVYQGAVAGLDDTALGALEIVSLANRRPDLTLVLDVDPAIGLGRAQARRSVLHQQPDRFEVETAAFHQRVRSAFLALAEAEPERCVVVDAGRMPDEVEAAIWSAFSARPLQRRAAGGCLPR